MKNKDLFKHIDFGEATEGPMGPQGETGPQGNPGKQGVPGVPGRDGLNGKDGKDGTNGLNGQDGTEGPRGLPGANGKDGSPDSPVQIADKLNTLEESIDGKVIKGMADLRQQVIAATSLPSTTTHFLNSGKLIGRAKNINLIGATAVINGDRADITITPSSATIGGSIANGQMAFGSGTNTIQGTANATLTTAGDGTLNSVTVKKDLAIGTSATPDPTGGYAVKLTASNLSFRFVNGTYNGIGGNGVNLGYTGGAATVGFNGFMMENSTNAGGGYGLTDFAWGALAPSGGSYFSSVRFETRPSYRKTGGPELQFGSMLGNYVGGFGWQPNLLLGPTYSTVTSGLSIGEGLSPTTPPSNGLRVAGAVIGNSSGSFSGSGSFGGNLHSGAIIDGTNLGIGTASPSVAAEIYPISGITVTGYTDFPSTDIFTTSNAPIDVGSANGLYQYISGGFQDSFYDGSDGHLYGSDDGHTLADINYTTGDVDTSPYQDETIDQISYDISVPFTDTNAILSHAQVEATGFHITGGTSSQFPKADGSVDSTTYLPYKTKGTVTLVAGTKAVTISGVTTGNQAFAQLTTTGGTLGANYKAVCTANTLTITSVIAAGTTQTLDTSTLNYLII